MTKKLKNRIITLIKNHSALVIFILTAIGTFTTIIIKGLAIVFQVSRYKKLCIPLHYIDFSVSIYDIFILSYILVTIISSILLITVGLSYYKQIKAYWKYDALFHSEKQRKGLIFVKNFSVLFPFASVIFLLNYFSCIIGFDSNYFPRTITLLILLALIITEAFFANMFYEIVLEYSAPENHWKFEPYSKDDKYVELTQEELEKANLEYNKYYSFSRFNIMKSFSIMLLIISMIFYFAFLFGGLSVQINDTYQIVHSNNETFAVLGIYENQYIISKSEIVENDNRRTIIIHNHKQQLIDCKNIVYEYLYFDDVNLRYEISLQK